MSNKVGFLKYVLGAAILVLIILAASILDGNNMRPIFSVAAKAVISVVLLVFISKNGGPLVRPCEIKCCLLPLIPFVFAVSMSFVSLDFSVDKYTVVFGFLGVLTTVAVEEIYYRGTIIRLFRDEKITYRLVFCLAAVFSLSHAVNYFFADPLIVTLQLAIAFSLGLFTVGIQLKTGNILLSFLSHLALNGTSQFFALFSESGGAIDVARYFVTVGIMIVALSAIGLCLTKSVLRKSIN